MSITINFPVDELQLDDWIDTGYTTLKLYVSNSPAGPYSDSLISPNQTLAQANTAGAPHLFTFTYPAGNGAQWFKVLAYDGVDVSSINDSQAFHGGGGTTLEVIRQRIGTLTHTMFTGTITNDGAVDGSNAISNVAKFTRFRDNYFGGGTGVDGWFYNDLTNDEWTVVSNWVQSSGTFTLSPPLGNQTQTGDLFEVMARWTPDEYRDAINWAIVSCYPTLSKPVIDTSITTEEDVFIYQIPHNIRILNKVEMEHGDDPTETDWRTRGNPWREIAFDEIDDGLTRYIEFKVELIPERRLRLTGTSILSQLYNNSDYVEIIDPQVDMLVYMAAHRLYAMLSNTDAASDVDRVRDQANYYLALYNENKGKRATRRKSKRIWGHDAQWSRY